MHNSPWHGKRLLLVDDEPELLAFVSGILTDAGFTHVFTASNVTGALDRIDEVVEKLKEERFIDDERLASASALPNLLSAIFRR